MLFRKKVKDIECAVKFVYNVYELFEEHVGKINTVIYVTDQYKEDECGNTICSCNGPKYILKDFDRLFQVVYKNNKESCSIFQNIVIYIPKTYEELFDRTMFELYAIWSRKLERQDINTEPMHVFKDKYKKIWKEAKKSIK